MSSNERSGSMDAQIQAARARGDFDELPGHGKPLPPDPQEGLDGAARFDALLLRTLGELPLEVTLAREIRACRVALSEASSEGPDGERLRTSLRANLDELMTTLKARRGAAPKASRG